MLWLIKAFFKHQEAGNVILTILLIFLLFGSAAPLHLNRGNGIISCSSLRLGDILFHYLTLTTYFHFTVLAHYFYHFGFVFGISAGPSNIFVLALTRFQLLAIGFLIK